MFVKEQNSNDLIRVSLVDQLISPLESKVLGRRQAGEEEQDERLFDKSSLEFPSGEPFPQCWTDEQYQVR
ncbi:acetyltransferase [Stieleria varia]|nr:acetyltransferase [Stieleria varia]